MKRTTIGNIITVCLICLSLLSNLSEPVVACPPDPPDPPPEWGCYVSPKNPAIHADPVFLKTGEFYTSATDLIIWGRVLPVKIVRKYHNQQKGNYGYGYCWDLNYNMKIERVDPNWLVLRDGEFRKLNYVHKPGTNYFEGPPGYDDYIRAAHDGYGPYMFHKKHGIILDFGVDGKLDTIRDRNDNRITFAYTGGRLTSITDDLNRTITLQYNAEGHLWKITDFTTPPRTWEYEYENNNLRVVKLPETDEYSGQSRLKITYTYDSNHNLLSITDPKNSIYLTNTYTDDKVTSQTCGEGEYTITYDPDNNKAGVTDRKGFYTEIEYNSMGNPIRESIENPNLSYTTRYEYNSNMDRTKIIFPKGNCIDFTYDYFGNLTGIYRKKSSSDGNPISTIFTYYVYDFVQTITDPKGNTTTFTYDWGWGAPNLAKITYPAVSGQNPEVNFTCNQYGQIETVTAPDGIETKYEYYTDPGDGDNYGRLKKVIRDSGTGGLNLTTSYEYDKWGKVEKVTGPDLNTWEFTHNELELLKQIKAPSPFEYITKLSYNSGLNLAKLQGQLGPTFDDNTAQTTLLSYGTLEHLSSIENPLGNSTYFSYDKNENLSRIMDPGLGQVTCWTDFGYDERNLLRKVVDANDDYNQYHGETKFSYDDNGNLSKIEDANKPQGHITLYDYDLYDRLEKITYHGYIYDDYAVNEVYSYDQCSNVISWKNRKGQIFQYQYDALNRPKQKNCPDGRIIKYEYDIAGRLKKVDDSVGGITQYSYDRLGRVELVQFPDGKIVRYTYDEMGRRTELTYPDSSSVTYEYDALSRLKKVKKSGSTLAEYDYDELSRRTRIALCNGFTEALYDYQDKVELNNDNFGNNIETLTHNFNGSVTEEYAYTYDNVGNLTGEALTVSPPEDPHLLACTNEYDKIYQLGGDGYFGGDYAHIYYDTLGNRTEFNMTYGPQLTKEYTMSEKGLNQYESMTQYDSEFPYGLLFTYTYDDNGNLTDIDSSEDSYDYIYDCENRLIEAKKNGQTVGTYTYDFAGRRVTKTVGGRTTKYYYDGDQVIAEYEDGGPVRKYVYGPGIDEPIMMTSIYNYYYHYDRQGSIVALCAPSGYIVENYEYDAFGKCLVHTDPGPDGLWMTADDETDSVSAKGNPYTFTGRRYDPETGLYYYRTRMYDPGDGRFLQTDPIGYAGGMNLYTYCGNNPVNWIDPFGLCVDSGSGTLPWTAFSQAWGKFGSAFSAAAKTSSAAFSDAKTSSSCGFATWYPFGGSNLFAYSAAWNSVKAFSSAALTSRSAFLSATKTGASASVTGWSQSLSSVSRSLDGICWAADGGIWAFEGAVTQTAANGMEQLSMLGEAVPPGTFPTIVTPEFALPNGAIVPSIVINPDAYFMFASSVVSTSQYKMEEHADKSYENKNQSFNAMKQAFKAAGW